MSFRRRLAFGGFSAEIRENWCDITASLDQAQNPPLTLALKENSVRALQFSPAIYKGGPEPKLSFENLISLFYEFQDKNGLVDAFDNTSFTCNAFGIGSSFHSFDDFIRVWYLSDGSSLMLVTYVCDWRSRFDEASEAESIVKSVIFCSSGAENNIQ